jgi:hypothetical protein
MIFGFKIQAMDRRLKNGLDQMSSLGRDFLEQTSITLKFPNHQYIREEGRRMNKVSLRNGAALVLFALSLALVASAVRGVGAFPFSLPRPTIFSCNGSGVPTNQFGQGETVFAYGDGYDSNEVVTIYVQRDSMAYAPSTPKALSVQAQADGSGHLGTVSLGKLPMGGYDIWVDRGKPPDGWLEYSTEPSSGFGCGAGLLVVPEYWMGTVLGLVGCFAAFGAFRLYKIKRK